jgi:hypothetical protein
MEPEPRRSGESTTHVDRVRRFHTDVRHIERASRVPVTVAV